LTEIPPAEMKFEVSGSKQCLIDNGIEDVNYFSYPKNEGSADKAVVELYHNITIWLELLMIL
jgi:hypothetical protein